MKTKSLNRVLLGVLFTGLITNNWANPTGGNVAAGSATIAGQGTPVVTINQSSETAIINWNSFSVANGELTQFLQPNSEASVLNRVLGGSTSYIDGTITATGHFYLINQNGIVIGSSGLINAAGFTASTREITDQNFSTGNLHFIGSNNNGVHNLGTINALNGDVVLIGKTVDNQGTINAPNGQAALIAGDDVLLGQTLTDGSTVLVTPSATASSASGKTGVSNSGTIKATTAELKAANGNLYALAINNSGTIRATTVTKQGGKIWLTSDSGTVKNTGNLLADATTAGGTGGTVSVINHGGTAVHSGTISAKGGQGGTGGNAEISGDVVNFTGTVDLSAPSGTTGNLLLDPTTLNVITGGSTTSLTATTVDPTFVDSSLTNANVTLSANNNITVSNAISWNSANTLTLTTTTTGATINLNAAITDSNASGGLTIKTNAATDVITPSSAGAIQVANFILQNGAWTQNANGGTLAGFAATNNFSITGGTFLRVAGGTGAIGNPYQIADIYGLQGIGSPSNALLSSNFVQTANIDASGTKTWNSGLGFIPIGNGNSTPQAPFLGSYNGNNNTISGLTINNPTVNYQGLFGYTGAGSSLSNITLNNISISGNRYVGGIVGYSNSTLSNDSVIGTSTLSANGTAAGRSDIGGLVGYLNTGSVNNSFTKGTITVTGQSDNAGGIIGYIAAAAINVSNSFSNAKVTGRDYSGALIGSDQSTGTLSNLFSTGSITGRNYIGGLIGWGNGSSSNQILNSYSSATVSATGNDVGGLIGQLNNGTVQQSFATGNVTVSGTSAGGLIGNFNGGSITQVYSTGKVSGGANVGGLAGNIASGKTITQGYTVSPVTGTSNVGAVVGNNAGTLSSIYYASDKSLASLAVGTGNTTGITQSTYAQMIQASTFSGWNYTLTTSASQTGVWGINGYTNPSNNNTDIEVNATTGAINNGLPYFQWLYQTPTRLTAQNQIVAGGTPEQPSANPAAVTTSGLALSSTTPTYGLGISASPTLTLNNDDTISFGPSINLPPINSGNINTKQAVELQNGYAAVPTLAATTPGSTNPANTSTYGQNVQLGVTFATATGAPATTGTLTFTDTYNGTSYQLATGATASTSTPYMNAGTNSLGVTESLSNYTNLGAGTVAPIAFTVNQAAFTVEPTLGETKTYGSGASGVTLPTNPFTVTGIANGDTFTGASRSSSGDAVTADTGTYAVTPSNATGTLNSNSTALGGTSFGQDYAINYQAAANALTINPLAITATISGQASKQYDGGTAVINPNNPTAQNNLSIISSGTVNGDTIDFTGTTYAYDSPNASSNPVGVTASNIALGTSTKDKDYTLSGVTSLDNKTIGTISAQPINYSITDSLNNTYGTLATLGTISYIPTISGTAISGLTPTTQVAQNGTVITLTPTTNAGSYTESLASISGNSNFILASSGNTPGTIKINPLAITTGLTGTVSKTYDGTNLVNSTDTGYNSLQVTSNILAQDQGTVQITNTGYTYSQFDQGKNLTVTANGLALTGNTNGNYTFSGPTTVSEANAGTINPLALTVSLSGNVSKVYDGTNAVNPTDTGYSSLNVASNIINNDPNGVTLTNTGYTYSQANQGSGLTVTANGLTLNNNAKGDYTLSQSTVSEANAGTITPALLTYTAATATRVYGAANPALTGTLTGFVAGENESNATTGTLSFVTPADNFSNVGSYAINGTGVTANNGNYTITQAASNSTALSITPATVTISANPGETKTYGSDGSNPANVANVSYTVTGLVNNDTYSGYVRTSAGDAVNAQVANGPYDVTINTAGATGGLNSTSAGRGGSFNQNYKVVTTTTAGGLTINPLAISVALGGNTTKVYDRTTTVTTPSTLQLTATGVLQGDTVNVTGAQYVYLDPNASPNPVGIQASGYSLNNSNYTLSPGSTSITNAGIGAITPKPISVTFGGNTSKTYDGTKTVTDPSGLSLTAGTSNGVIAGDTVGVTGATYQFDSANAGNPVGVNASGYSLNNSNYQLNSSSTTVDNTSIGKINQAALSLAADNQTKTYGQLLNFTGQEFTSTGLQNGETIGSVSLSSTGAAATAGVTGSPYTINISNATGGSFNPNNYTIAYNAGALTVNPASLTLTVNNAQIPQNQPLPKFTSTLSGFVLGQTQQDALLSLNYNTSATASSPQGFYSVAPTNVHYNDPNYSVTGLVDGTLTIGTPLPVIVPTNSNLLAQQTANDFQYQDQVLLKPFSQTPSNTYYQNNVGYEKNGSFTLSLAHNSSFNLFAPNAP